MIEKVINKKASVQIFPTHPVLVLNGAIGSFEMNLKQKSEKDQKLEYW